MLKKILVNLSTRTLPSTWEKSLRDSTPFPTGEFLLLAQKTKAKHYEKELKTDKASFTKALYVLFVNINIALRENDKDLLKTSLVELNKLTLLWISLL